MTAAFGTRPDGNPPRVLFVDDDENLLAALRRATRVLRGPWQLQFACGGQRALETLEDSGADVVVSDFRMPGVDGGQLMAIVHSRWPRSVRIILSGHADGDALAAAMEHVHDLLRKPCPPDEIFSTIDRHLASAREEQP